MDQNHNTAKQLNVMQKRSALKLLGFSCAIALLSGDLLAEKVFKCVVNGKTVYQGEPCSGRGTSLNIKADLNPEQHEDALRRANKDRQLVSNSSKPLGSPPSPSQAAGGVHPVTRPAAGPAIDKQRAIADCESQRGVHCRDPKTITGYGEKNIPITPEQQRAIIAEQKWRERTREMLRH